MFESVEFDNGFLSKLEFEENKNKINLSGNFCNSNCSLKNKTKNNQIFEDSKILNTKDYYDLSLTLQDISESMIKNNYRLKIEKKISNQDIGKSKEKNKICLSPLSPIKGNSFCSYKRHLSFSSTPLRDNSNIKNLSLLSKTNDIEKIENSKIFKADISEYAYIDADLFEDWNDCKPKKKSISVDKTSFTISQSNNLIKEPEVEKENEECVSDNSIDLLTGEVILSEKNKTENLFLDSFNFSNIDIFVNENKKDVGLGKNSFCLENKFVSKNKNKSLVAQKLDFDNSYIDSNKFKKPKLENADIGFHSDDSFEALMNLDLTQNWKKNDAQKYTDHNNYQLTIVSSPLKLDANISKEIFESSKKSNAMDMSDSACFNLRKKKGKFIKILESDSEEDESLSRIVRQSKNKNSINKIEPHEDTDVMFFDLEAEVSDDGDISSDESMERLDEYEKSFIDENSYFTQNNAEGITAHYLESVKCIENNHGRFKIPKAKPYVFEDVCSQISPDKSSSYEFDSFCVNDIEFDEHLSDLEIAEQVLEMERRENKKKKQNCKELKKKKKH